MSIGFLVQKSALISSQTQTTSLSCMYECVCAGVRECMHSSPREALAERYLFTPLAELMEFSGSDRPA